MNFKNLEVDGKNYWWSYHYAALAKEFTVTAMPERVPMKKREKKIPGNKTPKDLIGIVMELIEQIE
jgi:hypothetical protein